MKFSHTDQDGHAALSVYFPDGTSRVLTASHPNFDQVVLYLAKHTDSEHDPETVLDLVEPARYIGRQMAEITDRVTYDSRHLFLDGMPFDGFLADEIRRRLENPSADDEWKRLIRFAVNVDANPSRLAQQAVYRWVQENGLTITEDGCFLGHKAVDTDMMSRTAGPANYINGRLYRQGRYTRVPHEIGTVVSKKRADVDDTPGGGCSVGLHVGTESYAKGFAPVQMTVKVNPADVVSVPDGYDLHYKIRVCRYEVVAFSDPRQFSRTSWDPQDREARMRDLEGLSEAQREVYDQGRKDEGLLHADALAEARAYYEPQPEPEQPDTSESDGENMGSEGGPATDVVTEDEIDAAMAESIEGKFLAVSFDGSPSSARLQIPEKDEPTLSDWAEINQVLRTDLEDTSLGHKPLARKWSEVTTEASVRRYRKAHDIRLDLVTRVRDAVS